MCEAEDVTTCVTWTCVDDVPDYPECCPNLGGCIEIKYRYSVDYDFPITRANLDQCTVQGAAPYTYKIENLSNLTGNFVCTTNRTSTNPLNYQNFSLENTTPAVTGIAGDPSFTTKRERQRFYKSPNNLNGTVWGTTAGYTPYCVKIHSTETQEVGIENRTMILSGRNIYNYTGPLSGDPYISHADPFWDNPGGSGIKQMEMSIPGRSFPSPDWVLQLPLWGQESNDNFGIVLSNCVSPYVNCFIDGATRQRCVGCHCLRSGPVQQPAQGHYLPNDQGYTAGYFSFSEFNPESYIDHVYIDAFNNETIRFAGGDNALGFGNVGSVNTEGTVDFNCDNEGDNCVGCSGATSHGPRLGVPTCSVWSLMKALYARVLHSYLNDFQIKYKRINSYSLGVQTEADFRGFAGPTGYKTFSDAIDTMLSDDPGGTINGTSKVQYHMAKVADALEKDSAKVLSTFSVFPGDGSKLRFTFPNVFLWNNNTGGYLDATSADRWKHLYVVGNGNVVWDSRSLNAAVLGGTGPYGRIFYTPGQIHEDVVQQNYITSVAYLNEINHQKGHIVEGGGNHARVIVFPGSGGTTQAFSSDLLRRNAAASVSLVELPLCGGITAPNDNNSGVVEVSLCSICNALPGPVCRMSQLYGENSFTADGANTVVNNEQCAPVNSIDGSSIPFVTCGYLGGNIIEFNGITASYQIR